MPETMCLRHPMAREREREKYSLRHPACLKHPEIDPRFFRNGPRFLPTGLFGKGRVLQLLLGGQKAVLDIRKASREPETHPFFFTNTIFKIGKGGPRRYFMTSLVPLLENLNKLPRFSKMQSCTSLGARRNLNFDWAYWQ